MREDDAARAVSAAAEIVERIRDLAISVKKDHGVALAVRVGVNTGEVMAPTEVRPDQPMVTGDAINVAARLETAAQPGGVLVGDRTFRSTQSLFRFGDPVELTLKGKAAPVTAHPLLGRIEGAVEADRPATFRRAWSVVSASSACSAPFSTRPSKAARRASPSFMGLRGSARVAWSVRHWRLRRRSDPT